jgi:ribosome-binding factor A
MPRDFKRTDRIADQIQRDLADLIRSNLKDPRLGLVTVNDVRVARDMGYADVYITLLSVDDLKPDSPEIIQTVKILNGAAGFLRTELGKIIRLRTIPKLRFFFDETVRQGRQMDSLIQKARQKDQQLASDSDAVSEPSED